MKKFVLAAVAAVVLSSAALSSPAEARCLWNGYGWHCWHPHAWGWHHHHYWGPYAYWR
jgi:hypothetical protein